MIHYEAIPPFADSSSPSAEEFEKLAKLSWMAMGIYNI